MAPQLPPPRRGHTKPQETPPASPGLAYSSSHFNQQLQLYHSKMRCPDEPTLSNMPPPSRRSSPSDAGASAPLASCSFA
eukprot:8916763-Pyramimonas_sp.AAC.1